MARHYLLPDGGFVTELGARRYFLPGAGFVKETPAGEVATSSGGSTATADGVTLVPSAVTAAGTSAATATAPATSSPVTAAGAATAAAVGAAASASPVSAAGASAASATAPDLLAVTSAKGLFLPDGGFLRLTKPESFFLPGAGFVRERQTPGPIATAAGTSAATAAGMSLTSSGVVASGVGAAAATGASSAASAALAAGTSTALAAGDSVVRYGLVYYSDQDLFNAVDIDVRQSAGSTVSSDVTAEGGSTAAAAGRAVTSSPASAAGSSSASATATVPGSVAALDMPAGAVTGSSIVKPVGYTGPYAKVRRTSDNAERVIQFGADGWAEIPAAIAWAAGSPVVFVERYDVTGNGNHHTAAAKPPLLRAANDLGGLHGVSMVSPADGGDPAFFELPSTVVVRRQACTIALCLAPVQITGQGFAVLGTDPTYTNNFGLQGPSNWTDTTFRGPFPKTNKTQCLVDQPVAVILTGGPAQTVMRYNGYEMTAAAAPDATLVGGYIGKSARAQEPYSLSENFCEYVYPAAVSTAAKQQMEAEWARLFGVRATHQNVVVWAGDSITAANYPGVHLRGYVRQAVPQLAGGVATFNVAVSGTTMATTYANRLNLTRLLAPTAYGKRVAHVWAATNDVQLAAVAAIGTVAADTWNNATAPLISYLLANGFDEVVVGTMLPRGWYGTLADPGNAALIAQRKQAALDHNQILMDSAAALGATRADYAGLFSDMTYEQFVAAMTGDGIHPLESTCAPIAALCAGLINPFL